MANAQVSAVLCSPWALPDDVPAVVRQELDGVTDEQIASALERASEILWMLSGRRWSGGGCTAVARLVSRPTPGAPWSRTWGHCGCWDVPGSLVGWSSHIDQPRGLRLPTSPVTGITSVVQDGVTLPSTAYLLGRTGWLERVDGGVWSVCDADTVITYTYGEAPPAGGRDAAVTLGVELLKDSLGLKGCRLPKRVTSVTRQAVSMTMLDPSDFLNEGLTGLTSVDLWLRAVNPEQRPQSGGVWSLDVNQTRKDFP
jgi:hypothetical protein